MWAHLVRISFPILSRERKSSRHSNACLHAPLKEVSQPLPPIRVPLLEDWENKRQQGRSGFDLLCMVVSWRLDDTTSKWRAPLSSTPACRGTEPSAWELAACEKSEVYFVVAFVGLRLPHEQLAPLLLRSACWNKNTPKLCRHTIHSVRRLVIPSIRLARRWIHNTQNNKMILKQ